MEHGDQEGNRGKEAWSGWLGWAQTGLKKGRETRRESRQEEYPNHFKR